jgi:hypothetical protein
MMQEDVQEDARRAALVVHALPDRDREWLLQRIAPPQRQLLEPLLQELEAIGIPRAPGLLQDMRGASGGQAMEQDAQAESLRRVLEAEPLQLTAAILSLRDWPLAARFAAALGPQRRAAALLAAPGVPAPPALRDAVLQAVEQAITDELRATKRPNRASWLRIAETVRRRFS